MSALGKIPVTVVTGFLGAGKTTLIRHVLEHAGGRRLALIVNEFGDVGVDGDLLASCGVASCPAENIVELANGCICCTVADDFMPAIEALLARTPAPEHIIVETSGLALPKPLVKAFDWPAIRARLTIDGVVAVVDGPAVAEGRFADDPARLAAQRSADPALDHDNPLEEVFGDQLACADLVVLNKVDLLSGDMLARLENDIAARLPRAVKVLAISEGRIAADLLLGLGAAAEADIDNRPSCHDGEDEHDHDDFTSFSVELEEVTDPQALVGRLARVAAEFDVLRVKGYVHVRGKPMRLLVQGVGTRFRQHFDRPWQPQEARRSRLVVIGRSGLDRDAVTKAILGEAVAERLAS